MKDTHKRVMTFEDFQYLQNFQLDALVGAEDYTQYDCVYMQPYGYWCDKCPIYWMAVVSMLKSFENTMGRPVEAKRSVPGTLPRKTYKMELIQDYGAHRLERKAIHWKDANVVTSEIVGADTHAPAFDVDFPVTVVSSSTEGHYHLYIDKEMSFKEYIKLLKAMVDAGIVQEGYYKAAAANGYTTLRLPWIKKGEEK